MAKRVYQVWKGSNVRFRPFSPSFRLVFWCIIRFLDCFWDDLEGFWLIWRVLVDLGFWGDLGVGFGGIMLEYSGLRLGLMSCHW